MRPDDVKEQAETEHDRLCENGSNCPDRRGHIDRTYTPRILRERLTEAQKGLHRLRTTPSAEHVTARAEEPIDAKMERLERQNAKVQVIDMILSYRNKATDEDRLRQIKVVVE